MTNSLRKEKELGQVFTPDYVVDLILDDIGYTRGNILGKTIMEPSFGNGVFLIHITQRIIEECRFNDFEEAAIKEELEKCIYGIEIDKEAFDEAIIRLNALVRSYRITDIHWNLYNQDALTFPLDKSFDFVVGNPPYIRIHNMSESMRTVIKTWSFSSGTTDLYILFFELGIKMLNPTGRLGYITPNSWITNTSQGLFRNYLIEHNLLSKIEDFGSYKVFDADTYTCITILDKSKRKPSFTYSHLQKQKRIFCTEYQNDDMKVEGTVSSASAPWVLTDDNNRNLLMSIRERQLLISDLGVVQYGFATNKDDVFICKHIEKVKNSTSIVIFNGYNIEKKIVKPIVKGSRYHGEKETSYILFPYKEVKGKYIPMSEQELSSKYPLAYQYLSIHRPVLEKRDLDAGAAWFQFGRSQGLANCKKPKLVVNHIISPTQNHVEVYELPADTFVYSGMYITSDRENGLAEIKEELTTESFLRYAFLNGKDMSGGYRQFNTKTVKSYPVNSIKYSLPGGYNKENVIRLFEENLTKSYCAMFDGVRSTKKLKPIHGFIAELLQYNLGEDFTVISQGYREDTEETIQGAYYSKDVDICAMKDGVSLGAIAVKFVCSNYSQNSNNYFENMLGETANLRRNNNVYAQLIILPEYLPYYEQGNVIKKIEWISDEHITKYQKLASDIKNYPHTPDLLALILLDTHNLDYFEQHILEKWDVAMLKHISKVSLIPVEESRIVTEDNRLFIKKHSDIFEFIEAFANLVKAKSYGI